MKKSFALAAFIFGAFLLPLSADAITCSRGEAKTHCYCTFKSTVTGCGGETGYGGEACWSGSKSKEAACAEVCNKPHFNSGGAVAVDDYNAMCDMKSSDQCKSASNPQSPACKFCFCRYPNTAAFGACAGKTGHIQPTSSPSRCSSLCTSRSYESVGNAVSSYQMYCDFGFNGTRCTGPNAQQGKAGCAEGGGTVTPDTQTDANTDAAAQADRGSVIGCVPPSCSTRTIPQIIGMVINAVLGIMGSLAFLMFIYGGFTWMTAAGNDKRVEQGRQTIIWATLGIVAVLSSYALVSFLLSVLG